MRWLATFIAVAGLVVICADDVMLTDNGWSGIVLILTAVILFSTSGVLVKRSNVHLHPFATTVGALLLSLPLYGISSMLIDAPFVVTEWGTRSIIAIVYLALFGSLIGFVSYFYVLQKLAPSTVALVTLITPVFAILLGTLLNGETVGLSLMVGAVCVIAGLAVYHWGDSLLVKWS